MAKHVPKRTLIFQGIILAFILLVLDVAYAAGPEIPTSATEVKTWFESVITPLSDRKDTMEKDLVEAESAPTVIKVSKDATGQFKTIQEAIESVPTGNTKRVIISIAPGEYKEKIKVERFKPYITFLGDPKDRPVLTFDGTALKYGTVDSASLIVESDYFIGSNIIVQNTAPRPDGVMKDAQAAAIRISGDMSTFYNCKFIGFQDTVCDDKGKHFFMDCYIEGTVDFIFGAGQSLYLNSEIHVVPGDPLAVITAHARKNSDEASGYSFVHCNVTGTGGNTFLGRAWMEAARTVFSYCDLSDAIKAEGWNDFNKAEYQKTAYLAEFQNLGPGADVKARVPYAKQLAEADAKQFVTLEFIDGAKWILPPINEVPAGAAAGGAAAPGAAPAAAAAGAAPGAAPAAAAAGAAPGAAPAAAAAGATPGAAPAAAAAGAAPAAAGAGVAPAAAASGAAPGLEPPRKLADDEF